MEKYCRSTEVVPNPEFKDEVDSSRSVKQMYFPLVSSSSTLDKVFSNMGPMDHRK